MPFIYDLDTGYGDTHVFVSDLNSYKWLEEFSFQIREPFDLRWYTDYGLYPRRGLPDKLVDFIEKYMHMGSLHVISIRRPYYLTYPKNGRGGQPLSNATPLDDNDKTIARMSKTDKIKRMLYLALKKAGPAILNSFSKEDLEILAVGMAATIASEFTPVGWIFDSAFLAYAFYELGGDGFTMIENIGNAIYTAAYANSADEIDRAATKMINSTMRLGLDAVLGFILHKNYAPSAMQKMKAEEEIISESAITSAKPHSNEYNVNIQKQIENENYTNFQLGELRKAEDISTNEFTPLGINEKDADIILNSPIGKKMYTDYMVSHPDWSEDRIADKITEAIMSGNDVPVRIDNFSGQLVKIQNPKFSSPHPDTVYFTTQEELNRAATIAEQGGQSISEQFALPQYSTLDEYSIIGMESKKPTTLFSSRIAPTLENGIQRSGGAKQYLLFDQNEFNSLGKIGTITDKGVMKNEPSRN